jgi:dienelactone hydrolase
LQGSGGPHQLEKSVLHIATVKQIGGPVNHSSGIQRGIGAALAALVLIGAGGFTGAASYAATGATTPHAVGVVTDTFVDAHRPTPSRGPNSELPSRTLVTTIWYPAQGNATSGNPVEGATPDRSGGPYPLIVFGHGLGATPQAYEALLSRWAAAGYVVAAPLFPLTNANTPGGVEPNDVFNQPGDVSYVITSVLDASAQNAGTLAGLVAPHEVGVAGHSEGAITTLGFFNTCCRDPRVKGAEVLDGDPEAYASGHYDYSGSPPMLVVHGTADALLPYDQMVGVFNRAKGPKGLLALSGAGHGNWLTPSSKWFGSAFQATTDFFAAYLGGDKAALARIPADRQRGVSTMYFVPKPGSTTTIPTVPQPRTNLHATVTPHTNLANGQTVTVAWSGYTPGKVVNIVECSSDNAAGCDIAGGRTLTPDPTGKGTVSLQIVAGQVGTGVCDAAHPGCQVAVNDAGLQAPAATVRIPITFAS